jgi:hypothetical protein
MFKNKFHFIKKSSFLSVDFFVLFITSIGGSVVECSPATRAARVRFPADAVIFFINFCDISNKNVKKAPF